MHRILHHAFKIALHRNLAIFNTASRLDAPAVAEFELDIISPHDAHKPIETTSTLKD